MSIDLISIIVPCYNVGPFLGDTLASVLNQTYTNWECIIVNDGSPDNTHEVALEWEKKDNRFIYLKLENGGVERARNKGIERATGEYILPLDGDDIIAPNFLEKTVMVFKNDPDTMLVYTLVECFGDRQGVWNIKEFSLRELAAGNMIVCTALYRKKEWERTGGYDEKVKYHLEDWELWINMLKDGGKVVRLNEILFFYRIRPLSGVKLHSEENLAYMKRYIASKHYHFLQEQLGDVITLNEQVENYKNIISEYKLMVQQLSLRKQLKHLASNPLLALEKAKHLLTSKNKR